jgi:hypothetical protein
MKVREISSEKGIIAWFASNHVAANLLMLLIIAFGIVSAVTIRKQTTPDFELNNIQIRVPYLGAAPQEVEEGVVIKIEEAIQDLDGIVEINSEAREGMGTVTAEVATGADIIQVLSEVKTRVDAIQTFPGLTEKPIIYKQEVPIHVVFVSIYGDLDDFARKTIAQQVRDELMAIPSVHPWTCRAARSIPLAVTYCCAPRGRCTPAGNSGTWSCARFRTARGWSLEILRISRTVSSKVRASAASTGSRPRYCVCWPVAGRTNL